MQRALFVVVMSFVLVAICAPSAVAQQGAPAGYTFCAGEDYNCSFTGTKTVAYGAGTTFVKKTRSNGTLCANSVFGDPAPGVRKACYVQNAGGGETLPPGCRLIREFNQGESRDASGRVTVEASVIYDVNCNGREFYIYQYVNRPGFRVIRPPDWGHSIGGRDFSSFGEAIGVAAATSGAGNAGSGGAGSGNTGGVPAPGATAVGTWTYATDQNVDGLTTGEFKLSPNGNGKLTGTFQNSSGFNGEVYGNQQDDSVTLNINPSGWASDFVVKGKLVNYGGSLRIVGPVDHNGKTANFTATRR
jgi:hypothetical protein